MQQPSPELATLIGDVIGSRDDVDRHDLQRRLRQAFAVVNARVSAVQPLMMTIGDEFQAAYSSVPEAMEAQLRLVVALGSRAMIRTGIGWGPVHSFDPTRVPLEQDGPGWWRAREALEQVERAEHSHGTPPGFRTAVVTATDRDGLLNGYLVLRDHILDGLDDIDMTIVGGMLEDETFTAMARRLGLNKSSISRRAGGHGLTALVRSRPVVVDAPPVVDEDRVDA